LINRRKSSENVLPQPLEVGQPDGDREGKSHFKAGKTVNHRF